MEEVNVLMQERIKKLKKLRDTGIDPYGSPFPVSDKAADILEKYGKVS